MRGPCWPSLGEPMRRGLLVYSLLVLAAMLSVTAWAGRHENVLSAVVRMMRDPWSVATFADAYFGFLWFWLWIAATERRLIPKLLWLPAILFLGNLAMAAFVLLRLHQTRAEDGLRGFLMGAE